MHCDLHSLRLANDSNGEGDMREVADSMASEEELQV
jgi:hypothetical protein